jgi:hypothetical protein
MASGKSDCKSSENYKLHLLTNYQDRFALWIELPTRCSQTCSKPAMDAFAVVQEKRQTTNKMLHSFT